ncbi:uncharacterized mitochondrial protein AtMg00810-like [Lactuca sativa]|uniref:uncharacterized mitochondrial protein AtMg00810-like n=1 Tax=Lactuca sativa TaxID=4236 RepID=UPI000CD81DEC|nr:uncharacterized mitochondrial protein AtMg00810-like [Lactuca sativa]
MKKKKGSILIIGVYVDDLIVTGSHKDEIIKFKQQMSKEFEMSDLGMLTYYLGIEVNQHKNGLTLRQTNYANTILKKAGMFYCNPCKYPMESKLQLTKDEEGELVDPTSYRSIIGGLRYLTQTRPDIANSVGIVSRFMEKPTKQHQVAVKHILRYVKGTIDYGLSYTKGGKNCVIGYTDSDLARDVEDRKTNNAKCQRIWISRLLGVLTGRKLGPFELNVDNKLALDLMKYPKAGILTKPMNKVKFEAMRKLLGVKDAMIPD